MGNEQGSSRVHQAGRRHQSHVGQLPSNARLMGNAVKQRLCKGSSKSTYNMKVVIRGDRQTGKSALFHRLEGGGFIKEHRVTAQLQTSHVLWPYKTSDEMVNLEIWDVVDKAIVPTNLPDDGLTLTPSIVSKNLMPADATTIDVYKGAHAVIFMVDPTRKWTFEYVKGHIGAIPEGIDCVILFNKKDVNKHWTLTEDEISEFMAMQSPNVRALQISLQDCYGMKELHSFFNVPFLRMKAKYLQQELARAQREHDQSKVELDIFIKHQNYDEFLNRLRALKEHKNRRLKSPAPPRSPDSPVTAPALPVKQTVRSSKDLPLIQQLEQQNKEKQQSEAIRHRQQKQQDIATKADDQKGVDGGGRDEDQEDILEFKPTGGLNEDFFADVGGEEVDPDDEQTDSKEDEADVEGADADDRRRRDAMNGADGMDGDGDGVNEDMESAETTNGVDGQRMQKPMRPIMISADTVTVDSDTESEAVDEDEEEEEEDTVHQSRGSKSAEHVMNGHDRTHSASLERNGKTTDPDGVSQGVTVEDTVDTVSNHTERSSESAVLNGDAGTAMESEQQRGSAEPISRSGSGRKLQSLMKLHPADIHVEASDSDEYDDEPLVFATAPKEVKQVESVQSVKPHIRPKAKVLKRDKREQKEESEGMKHDEVDPIDLDPGNARREDGDANAMDRDQQEAFDSLLKDLGRSTSPASPGSMKSPSPGSTRNDDDSEDDEAARRRRREEKRARKEERRKRKEAKRRRKKERKRKRKSRSKKESDLQGFSDSDEVIEIE